MPIWDDDDYVQKDRSLVDIWFNRSETPQYYPLVFTSFWIDSRSTRISVRQSRDPFDGAQIVLYSTPLGEGTDARSSRTTTQLESDGTVVHRQVSLQPDGSERPVMELRLTRRARR